MFIEATTVPENIQIMKFRTFRKFEHYFLQF